nr:hypothetical protein [Tanacetum cinerariifolium]
MSDSDESGVTYTDISSPFKELSDIRSPRADDHEYIMMLEDPYVEVALQAPPFPDYMPGPEEPKQAPPSPDYIPGPEHADDEIVAEDQPYAEDASPIAQSPEYVPESDFEAHPEDDNNEDPEEDPVDYPADGGDDSDDEEESSEDDKDDDMDVEADEEEEEHPAPADSIVVFPTAADQAPSAEETKPFKTDESAATPLPHPAYRTTARISIPAPVPMPAWTDSEIVRLLAISSPPASPLSPWSLPLPSILSPPSPLPSASRREDRPEVTLPPQKRLDIDLGPRYEADYGFVTTVDREIMRDPEREREIGYGITDSWNEIVETLQGAPVSTDTELGGYVREFETRVRQDTNEIYMRLDDEQTERQLLAGRLNMLFRDRRAHAYTRHLMETEAKMSREAWMSEIRELQATDRRRQTMISELLRIDHRRSTEISEDLLEIIHSQSYQRRLVAVHRLDLFMASHFILYQPTKFYGFYPGYSDQNKHRSRKIHKDTQDVEEKQMAPRRTTRSTADQETINATTVTNTQLQEMIDQGVTATLATRDALRSTNGDDSHNSGTGVRRTERAARECTYTDFLKCQPLPFKGTEGVASLSQWCERMESVFHISNCTAENQVKFATCTLHSVALTWWNTHVQTVGHEAAYGMSWKTLMKMMTDKYCPRNEIRKLEFVLLAACYLWDNGGGGRDKRPKGSVL